MIKKCTGAAMLLLCTAVLSAQTGSVTLRYKFRQGEAIQYKTEVHDSMSVDRGGQSNVMKMDRHAINTLVVSQTPPDNPYKITVKEDTSWIDADFMQGMRRGGPRRPSDEIITMTPLGSAEGKEDVVSSFILPLPEQAVAPNDTWDFALTQVQKGRSKGTTEIKGQCLVYDITDGVAVIIVNLEKNSNGEFSGNMNGQEFNVKTQGSATGTQLVYFDVEKGRITEIVMEMNEESVSEGSMASSRSSKSKTTIRLMK